MDARQVVRRTGVGMVVAVGLVGLVALPASAHVTVHADTHVVGATDAGIAFRVLNEEDKATTTKVEVQLPTDHPLLGVLVKPMPGWSSAVKNVTLNPPVKTDDGEVTEAVSQITWTASSPSAGIPVGGYEDFDITAGKLPDGVSTLVFKAIQTYSDGTTVAWIEQAVDGQAEPEHPAAELKLGTAAASDQATAASTAQQAAAPTATGDATDPLARILGVAGILAAVLLGLFGYGMGRRAGASRGGGGSPAAG